MAIKHTDKHICEKCGKEFEWNYFESQRRKMEFEIPIVEEFPNKTLVHSFAENANGGYDVEVNCPFCDFDNHFDWSEANE